MLAPQSLPFPAVHENTIGGRRCSWVVTFCLSRQPLLITDNPALEKELQFASQSMPWVDPFFEEIGILLSFNGSMQGQVSGSAITWVMPSFHSLLVDVACNILVFAVEKGWPWIASTAMEALTGGGEHPSAVMASLEQRLEGQGTLLHLAVCSQEPAIVRWLLGWGQANGVAWDIHRPTAKGVSVLMLAKALPDPLISMELAGGLTLFFPCPKSMDWLYLRVLCF